MLYLVSALSAVVIGIYQMATHYSSGLTQMQWAQYAGLAVVGLIGSVVYGKPYLVKLPSLLAYLKSMLPNKAEVTVVKPADNKVHIDEPTEGDEMSNGKKIYQPTEYEIKDYECLIHLRNRVNMSGNAEGVEACNKLNQVMFELAAKERAEIELNEIK